MNLEYEQRACCYHLYRQEFKKAAKKLQIPNLPWHINDKIHFMKCFAEYTIDANKVRKILGYGQSQLKDDKLNKLFLKNIFHLDEEDPDVVIVAILLADSEYRFRDISYIHQNNIRIVITAMYDEISNFCYAGDTLQNDKKKMLEVLKNYPDALQYANEKIQTDKDIIDFIIRTQAEALNYAKHFNQNKELVLFAIEAASDGWILQYVSETLKNDQDVVLAAVKEDSEVFQFASIHLRRNKEFIKTIDHHVQICEVIQHADDTIKADKEIMLLAVAQDGLVLKHASKELKNDLQVATVAMKQYSYALDEPVYKNEITNPDVFALYKEHKYSLTCVSE